jgi:hypothetical protein
MLNGLVTVPALCAPAFDWPLLITYTNLVQAIILIPLQIFLIEFYQGIGAAFGWVIINSTYLIFMVPIFFKRFLSEEKLKWYKNDIIIPFLVSFVVCGVIRFMLQELNSTTSILIAITLTSLILFSLNMLLLNYTKKWIFSTFKMIVNYKS